MKQGVAQFIQLLMMVLLLATPSNVISCPVVKVSQPDMSCCGPSCPCPTAKICAGVLSSTGERSVSQTQPEISYRAPVLLYSLNFERETFSTKSVKLAMENARPPPLVVGSPPQAKLRVWIL
jgi:hypothetical protein